MNVRRTYSWVLKRFTQENKFVIFPKYILINCVIKLVIVGNGLGKVGKAANLEGFIMTLPSLLEGQSAFSIHFEYNEDIGIPGAFAIKNNLLTEFYLVSLTLDDIPNHDSIHFVCNSWIYPSFKYKSDRIFFANKVYYMLICIYKV